MQRSLFGSWRRRARRVLAGVAAGGVTVGLLVSVAGSAQAVACGGGAQSGLTITARHATTFYTDLGAGFDAAYLAYSITNSGSARTNLWVRVAGFTGGSVTLADTTADRQQIASLPGSASATAFFLTKASALSSAAQTHTVSVYDRRPDLSGASVLAACDYSFTTVANTIGANANKVTAIASTPASPQIGQAVTVTVDGQTGTTSGAMWVSPASSSLWPSKALRLESTLLEVNTNGTGPVEETYTNSLFIPSAQASLYTSQTTYRATYVFRVTGAPSSNPTIKPVAQISSGGQFKHTGSFPTLPTISASTAAASITMTKTITAGPLAGLPTTTAPNGVSGATTYAEVPYKVEGTAVGGATAVVDEFVDVPAAGVLFRAGSALLSDTTRTAAAVADPATSPTDTGALAGALHFTGPFTAAGATTATITYTMYVPLTAGTYTNQAYATINGTTIGASPGAVPTVTVTADGTALTGWSSGTSGASTPTAQAITFAQPSNVTFSAGTRSVSATSDSGLTVVFTSSTTGVCTVTGTTVTFVSAGTCTIDANQPGNGTYAAAGTVTRSFTVVGTSQAITFAQPTDVPFSAGTRSVSATSSSGLTVGFSSSTTGVCTVSGATVTSVSAGTCTIDADQAGNGTYAAASTVTRSFAVVGTSQVITFAQPTDVPFSAGTRSLSAMSDSGLAVAFTSSTTGICTVTGTTVTLLSTGTCTIDADQPGDSTYAAATTVTRSFAVTSPPPPQAGQTITFAQPSDVSISAGTRPVAATSSANLPVTLTSFTPSVCTVTGPTITMLAVGTCTIAAIQAGNGAYEPASLTRSFQVTAPTSGPDAAPVTTTGTGRAAQSASVLVPAGGSLMLLTPGGGEQVSTVTTPGEGVFTLDPATGIITFAPAPGFVGTATPVTYQVTNAAGVRASATYTPTVTALSGTPTAGSARQGDQVTLTPTVTAGAPAPAPGTLRLIEPDGTPTLTLIVPSIGTYRVSTDTSTDGDSVTFTPSPRFTGRHEVTYRVQDVEGNVIEAALIVRVSALAVTVGTDTINPAQTGRARLRGVPAGATVTLRLPVAGASKVSYTGGQINASAAHGFTGEIRVPVTVVNGTATVHLTALITVRPLPATHVRYRTAAGGDTVITWDEASGAKPHAYLVRIGGHLACRATTETCTVDQVVAGPKSAVTVTAVGGDDVPSPSTRGRYHPRGCASIGAVYFATDSAALTKATRHELNRVARILGPEGFTRACLVGHTDNSAASDYNLKLSQRRVRAVATYLHTRARRVRYDLSHVGEDDPAKPNTSEEGKAANRRVEVGVS